MTDIPVLMGICLMGYLIAFILGLPAPGLFGPMLTVLMCRGMGVETAVLPGTTVVAMQMLLGVYIGVGINRKSLNQLKSMVQPVIAISVWVFTTTFIMGLILGKLTGEDLMTTVLSVAPAGVSEISMLAISIDANTAYVGFFQLSRFLLTLWLYPLLVTRMINESKHVFCLKSYRRFIQHKIKQVLRWRYLLLGKCVPLPELVRTLFPIFVGIIGGWGALKLKVPAGPLIGSFLAVALVSLKSEGLNRPPMQLRLILQMGMGATIGNSMAGSSHLVNAELAVLTGLFSIFIIFSSMGVYLVLRRITQWEKTTCLLAAAPAGTMVMTLLADELQANALIVSLMHLARQLTVKIIIVPLVLVFLL
ncbi:AbrB family transcriptional regulator [Anoxynatronum sibiricum]|uniref:AbrB family transcriptional regulator n=1 Tax=Anoxynatronum sibiricum TaxID=210623 RepID=A0ABU9VXV1_9CLOT